MRLIIIRDEARNVPIKLLIVFILAELRAIKVGSRSDNAACILPELKISFLIVCHDHISSTILSLYFLKNYCRALSCNIFLILLACFNYLKNVLLY